VLGITREAADLMKERDIIRTNDPMDPIIEALNRDISSIVAENRRNLWREKVQSSGSHPDLSKCWSLLRGLSGKRVYVPPNQPISFGSMMLSKPSEIAEKFNRQYVPPQKSDPLTRLVQQQLHKSHPIDHSFSLFMTALTEEALMKSSKSTANGPDGLTSLHLKHLGPAAISYLTEVFNLSVRDGVFPAIWEQALVLPILKPGKPADQGASYSFPFSVRP
jgi:hypothetical protein